MKKLLKYLSIIYVSLAVISPGICAQPAANTIKGSFPNNPGQKLYIMYFPPGLASETIKYTDSCIINAKGDFKFSSPFSEPVLASIYFDFTYKFDFVTDRKPVILSAQNNKRVKDFSNITANSLSNTHYRQYKKYLSNEKHVADSLYFLRERYREEKKRDSMKILEPHLETADSLLLLKNYRFSKDRNENDFIKCLVTYRKVMLKIEVDEVMKVYEAFSSAAKQSLYGKAILQYILAKAGLAEGSIAPVFVNQLSPEGKKIEAADFKGKYLFIDFWASWCLPCRAQGPQLKKLYDKYHSDKFEILGISLDENKNAWVKAIASDKLNWKHASDLLFWDSECVKLFGLYSIPFNVLLDTEGKIYKVNLSPDELSKELQEIFK